MLENRRDSNPENKEVRLKNWNPNFAIKPSGVAGDRNAKCERAPLRRTNLFQ